MSDVTDLKAEVLTLRMENAGLRKENDTLCRRIDELCMEVERLRKLNPLECALNAEQAYREQVDALVAEVKQLRSQRTSKRIVVSDGGVGHCACSACGGAIDQDDAWCRHCGARLEDA